MSDQHTPHASSPSVPSNSGEVAPQTSRGQVEEMTSKCYMNLVMSLGLLLVSHICFAAIFELPRLYKGTTPGNYDMWTKALYIILIVTLVFALLGATDKNPFVGMSKPIVGDGGRRKLLPVITVVVLVIQGIMIMISGGGMNSCYSHFLGTTSSIALIFAKHIRTRGILVASTATIFIATTISGISWVPITDKADPSLLTISMWFNITCFVVSTIFAALAGWRLRVATPEEL